MEFFRRIIDLVCVGLVVCSLKCVYGLRNGLEYSVL